MIDINKNNNISVSLLLLTAMTFMGTGVISKAEAGLPLPPSETLLIPIGNASDDAEEKTADGDMDLTSSDLEFTEEGGTQQILGLRFPLAVPPGATIITATIQFTVDEVGSNPTSLTIHGQDTNNAPTFSNTDFDISQRALTEESVLWEPLAWPAKGEAGLNQQTPDLTAIVQARVDQAGWLQDNAIAFIISGSGKRVAESFNGTAAPVLQVEFSLDPPPVISPLSITEVAVDTDTLMITGEAFDFNDILDLEVTLGDSSTGIGPGDITLECTSGTPPTDTSIVCDLSAGGLPEAGDYLLTVSTGAGQSQSDEYDLTIGAVGPQGEQGIEGMPGHDGAVGDQGIPGLQGIEGAVGPQGDQGIQGLPGQDGTAGATGAVGPQGPAGADSTVAGPAGQTGPEGPAADPAQITALQDQIDALQALVDALIYEIGDEGPAGGIVFHVTDGGIHGLEAAPADQSNARWCSSFTDIANVDNIGTQATPDSHSGAYNTPLIVATCVPTSAAAVASNYLWPNGQTDGFLPNKEELDLLYDQKAVVGGFANDFYWSSSDFDWISAWFQDFLSGTQSLFSKGDALRVRAVRAF